MLLVLAAALVLLQLLTEAMQNVHRQLHCCAEQQEVAGSAPSMMHSQSQTTALLSELFAVKSYIRFQDLGSLQLMTCASRFKLGQSYISHVYR